MRDKNKEEAGVGKDQQNSCETVNTMQESISDQNDDSEMCEIKQSENAVFTNEVVIATSASTIEKNDATMQVKQNGNKISPLDIIALEYDSSDSDTENSHCGSNKVEETQKSSEMDIQILSYRISRNEVSSSSESDSEDDSSSSDCTTETISDDSDSDSSTNKKERNKNLTKNRKIEMKNEWDDLPPIEDLKITVPEVLCEPLGEVAWMVEQLVVVQPKSGKPTLNLDTVLFIDKGKRTLGKIFDVFGQVNEPYYCVRFNSTDHIKESDVKVGMKVYYCPNTQYTSLVFLHELTKIKGTDGGGDDEPPEFSDDEEEQAYYEMLKQKQTNTVNDTTDLPFKRKRTTSPSSGWQSNHPWNRNAARQEKDAQRTKRDKRQFNSTQNNVMPYNEWSSGAYQNNWPPAPWHMHPAYADPYLYGSYLNPLQYVNSNETNTDQNFQDSQNNYPNERNVMMSPRVPFNVRHRFPHSFGSFGQNRPNPPFPNMRFRYPDTFWQASQSRMNNPWITLPPPPPPPPPS